ncbi:MAG: adenine nucleotide alpha hydrolase [Planctomycetes bacterium]|nr:adenine nucleotide alpha hydrolase [Planctomycetota bacterium]
MKPHKTLLSWSSGKDCAWALHQLRRQSEIEVVALLTSFSCNSSAVAMHGTSREMVQAQADALNMPLWEVDLPWPCTNMEYEKLMGGAFAKAREAGITHLAFGDLFLEDVRDYRIKTLEGTGLTPLFPIWCEKKSTKALAGEMMDAGFGARIICIDPKQLARSFLGSEFDYQLLKDLPDTVDPCGENGEFHTFCHSGPIFKKPIPLQNAGVEDRDGFCFMKVQIQK